jgi:hypothetical protein
MGDEAKRSTQGSAAPGWIYAAGGGGRAGAETTGERERGVAHGRSSEMEYTVRLGRGDEESVRDQWAGFRLEAGAGLRPVRCLVAAERAQGASTRRAAASRGWRAEGGRDI